MNAAQRLTFNLTEHMERAENAIEDGDYITALVLVLEICEWATWNHVPSYLTPRFQALIKMVRDE